MNIELSDFQSDTKVGSIPLIAGVDLSNAEGLLTKIGDYSGTPAALLPTSVKDLALYICMGAGVQGDYANVEAPSGSNARVTAYGTGSTGDVLILADPTANSGAQAGMVRSLVGNEAPTAPGLYFSPGIAEEDFVNGQAVKFRPFPQLVNITSPLNSFTDNSGGTAPAASAGVVTIPAVTTTGTAANAIAALIAEFNALTTALEAQGIVT